MRPFLCVNLLQEVNIMLKYEKPDGTAVEINEQAVPHAEKLGWKPAKAKRAPRKKAVKDGNSSKSN